MRLLYSGHLNHDNIKAIVSLEMGKLRDRVLENGYDVQLTDSAHDWLAQQGFSQEYGARPLRRLIQQQVETPLSEALLAGDFHFGETIIVDIEDDAIVIRSQEEPQLIPELNNVCSSLIPRQFLSGDARASIFLLLFVG